MRTRSSAALSLLGCLSLVFLAPLAAPAATPPSLPSLALPLGGAPPASPLAATRSARTGDAADGRWTEFGLLQVSHPVTLHDAMRNELVSVGGSREGDWALSLAGTPTWTLLPQTDHRAFGLFDDRTAAVDPQTGRVFYASVGDSGVRVAVLDPRSGLVQSIPAGPEPPVQDGRLMFDASRQRLVMYGGRRLVIPELSTDVWVLDLLPTPSWSLWTTTGTPPTPAYVPMAVLDPVRDRLVVFSSFSPHEVFTLPLQGTPEWTSHASNDLVTGENPNPFAYDPVSDRIWTIAADGEVFAFSPVTFDWTQVATAGTGPGGRNGAGLALDGTAHRLLLAGGRSPDGSDVHSDAWALSLDGVPAWTQLVPDYPRPPIRGGAGDGYDASRHRLVLFGGADQNGYFRNDTWALDLSLAPAWSPVATQGGPPPARYWHAAAWDDTHDRLVVFGGYYGDTSHPLGDLWSLTFDGGTPTWEAISPTGARPIDRMLSQLLYDPVRDRFLLFFGFDGAQVLSDVWELRLTPAPAWRQLAPSGSPPGARAAEMCAYDPVRDRVLLFGGSSTTSRFGDLWSLDLASGDGSWQSISTASAPSARGLGLLRYDSGHDRLLLFGGYGVESSGPGYVYINYLGDTWALDLSSSPAWRELAPEGPFPSGRDRSNGAYDPVYDRFVLTCGGIMGSNDTWALEFGDQPVATTLSLGTFDATPDRVRLEWYGASPGERVTAYRRPSGGGWNAIATLAADGTGSVVVQDDDVVPGARYEYRLGYAGGAGETFTAATAVQVPARALALSVHRSPGAVRLAIELPSGAPASLALFDVSGRRVWSRAVGTLGAGPHEIALEREALSPALYFARLTQGGTARTARVAIVR